MSVELQELIELLYKDNLSKYEKRKLEEYIKKQQKEIEALAKIEGYEELLEEN